MRKKRAFSHHDLTFMYAFMRNILRFKLGFDLSVRLEPTPTKEAGRPSPDKLGFRKDSRFFIPTALIHKDS